MSRISYEQALHLIENKVCQMPPVTVSLDDALGCVCAENIIATLNQPPFPRSPYDGYAIRAEDLKDASKNTPVTLKVIGESFAGAPADVDVKAGETVRIMTGGVIPNGADAVMMQEKTDYGKKFVNIFDTISPYQNYCYEGEEYKKGEILVHAETILNAAACAVISGSGTAEVFVYPKPHVGIISTGNEIKEIKAQGESLSLGQIYGINGQYIKSRLRELCFSVVNNIVARDEIEQLTNSIKLTLADSDLIFINGGISVGEKDLVPHALEILGAQIIFQGVQMKPGMPVSFAIIDDKPILAFSGNPFACAVTFELLGRKLLACMTSDSKLMPTEITAALNESYSKNRPIRRFARAIYKNGKVSLCKQQSNGQMYDMIKSNCLAELSAGNEILEIGETVKVHLLC